MISSSSNPKLKQVRALLSQTKARQAEKLLVLEGLRLMGDVMAQGVAPTYVLHRPDADGHFINELHRQHIATYPVEGALFDALSDTHSPQGLLGVFPWPRLPISSKASLLLALDGLRDPGNLGTIFRTAAAAGADGLLLLEGGVDPYNPKVLRAGMGAHFRLPHESLTWAEFLARFGDGWHLWRTEAEAQQNFWQVDWRPPSIILIGSEAHGASEQAESRLSRTVAIPMASQVESLNAAMAAGIFLFEIQRQRGVYSGHG